MQIRSWSVLAIGAVVCFIIEAHASATIITSVEEGKAKDTLLIRGALFGQDSGEVFLGTSELSILSWKRRKVTVAHSADLKAGTYLLLLNTAAGQLALMDVTLGSVGDALGVSDRVGRRVASTS